MKILLFLITFIIIHLSQIYSQSESGQKNIYLNTGARYVSGADGTIRMYVNIWGHISNPGRILVDEGIDIATLLSLSGGPNKGANFKKVKVYHEYPGKDGKIVHIIDLSDFLATGDRSNFIDIHPNDTFIIDQTAWSFIVEEINTVNTLMNIFNLYLNLTNLRSN